MEILSSWTESNIIQIEHPTSSPPTGLPNTVNPTLKGSIFEHNAFHVCLYICSSKKHSLLFSIFYAIFIWSGWTLKQLFKNSKIDKMVNAWKSEIHFSISKSYYVLKIGSILNRQRKIKYFFRIWLLGEVQIFKLTQSPNDDEV